MNTAVISVGSNIEPVANIEKARLRLAVSQKLLGVSAFVRTRPLGNFEQPDFLNGAFLVSTILDQSGFTKLLKEIENELGRQPSEEELAGALGVEMTEYYEIIGDVSSTALLSLDEMAYEEGDDKPVPLMDTLRSPEPVNALGQLEREEMRDLLADSLGQLSEQERLVVALYYYEELTLKEIGQVLELSESRVSQLHTKAVMSLRVKLRKRFMT